MPKRMEETLKRMDELQIAFIAKLGDKVKELSRLILQLDGSLSVHAEHNQLLLKKIHQLSHNLAGSAGTFKHTTVYNKAKAIENVCSIALQENASLTHWHRFLLEFVVGLRGDVQLSGRPTIVESFNSFLTYQEKIAHTIYDVYFYSPVIVVDDDEFLVRLIQEQAKHFEYHVIALLTTADLEAAIDEYRPAAILIDVIFPDAKHSGIEIINQLKAKNKINCPVIFMSNRCDMAIRLDALRAGSNAYIVKPLEILELIRILDRLTHKLTRNKSRILIVDDDDLSAKLYQVALENCDFICEMVLNPMEVINKVTAFNPDVILLDINMPNCNGFELAEVIRQDDAFCHIPILFLSTAGSKEQEIHAMASGGDDFLDKNADLTTLIAIIKGHVQRYKELDSVLARLKRDEVRFRSVTSSSSDAIISTDEKGRIVFWNEGAETIFGFSALEMIGQCLELIIPSENRKKYTKYFEKLETGSSFQLEKQCIERTAFKKDKTQINIELTHTEWASAHEKFYTAIIRNITHRKQIEQKLSNKEAYLNAVISSSGEAIITLNSEGIMETVNPKAQQLFGYPCHEMLGKNISTLILLPQKEWLNDDYYLHPSEFLYSVNQGDKECDGMRKDGEIFALELNISPMIIANQKKFVGILRDISENKQFLYEIMQAKSGAEAANRAKNQFLASMSHEFRTPLNAIMGFTQLLQTDTENPLNAEQLDFLNYIHDGGTRLLTLINDILDLSKIESGGLALQCENFALVQFVNEIITQIKPLVTQANLTINKLSDENLFFVKTDKLKLQQVINQLLSNAIKYNRPQGSISIYLTQVEKKIRLSISDTGKGISEQLLPELFKSFSRLDAQVGTIEGTGIGLTVTKKLIEMMNGKIGVTSRVGEGSTFWIELNSVSD